jgi:hypothetical protein
MARTPWASAVAAIATKTKTRIAVIFSTRLAREPSQADASEASARHASIHPLGTRFSLTSPIRVHRNAPAQRSDGVQGVEFLSPNRETTERKARILRSKRRIGSLVSLRETRCQQSARLAESKRRKTGSLQSIEVEAKNAFQGRPQRRMANLYENESLAAHK